ncbi:hypothetical protein GWO43_24640 [candidate division KSB1 bacterium]|nr:hypothetical protein [candidate division KSB1 bacterium]NIR68575.1 hypothetical protein [candidate division KSB1 bacterium]NIS27119.1 hypothetical protein [candidate division KSB1 bacterium]NIT74005.1 hypothetical protein [candidate division KSB1 bacterium]NIU27866.1 hypothetical protein [candidate division KSB1 bacterium]
MDMAEIAQKLNTLEFKTTENEKDIHGLKGAVYGDSNGRRGVVRRLDGVEDKINLMLKLGWAMLLMMIGIFGRLIYDLFQMFASQ